MLKTLKDFLNIEGQWVPFWIDEKISMDLKIRPLFPEILELTKNTHAVRKLKKSWKIKRIDWEGIADDLADYLLEDFRGFGFTKDQPAEANIRNKKIILNSRYKNKDGRDIFKFVYETAIELGKDKVEWNPKYR